MRVAEIMSDFRNLLNYLAAIRANPSAEEYNEEGYVLLRQCAAQSQQLLNQPFSGTNGQLGDSEEDRAALQRIITDASVRRFKAQRIYLRATAALRWVNMRAAILQGQRPHAGHASSLQQARNNLRQELSMITDQRVEQSLRAADQAAGKWLGEDPSLTVLLRLANNGSNGR